MYKQMMTEAELERHNNKLASLGLPPLEVKRSKERNYNRNLGVLFYPEKMEQLDFAPGYEKVEVVLDYGIYFSEISGAVKLKKTVNQFKNVIFTIYVFSEDDGPTFMGSVSLKSPDSKFTTRISCWWNTLRGKDGVGKNDSQVE